MPGGLPVFARSDWNRHKLNCLAPAGSCCAGGAAHSTVADCCKKWKSLRCRYRNERKKLASGAAGGKKPGWYLTPYLLFINPFIDDLDETTSNVEVEIETARSCVDQSQTFDASQVVVDSMFFIDNEETLDPSGNEFNPSILSSTPSSSRPASSGLSKPGKKDKQSLVNSVLQQMEREPPPIDDLDH